jgi:hypothetical protein
VINCPFTHGLIKKVAHTYKYSCTKLSRRVVVTALIIREYFVQSSLVRAALCSLRVFVQDFGVRDSSRCDNTMQTSHSAKRLDAWRINKTGRRLEPERSVLGQGVKAICPARFIANARGDRRRRK